MKQRDMSKAQFAEAAKRHGFTTSGFMGYYRLNIPGQHIEVSIWNAGSNRRAQLAYLLARQAEEEKKAGAA